jgi:ATP-dependent Clp protease ATP-binding subunit ClpA
MQTMPSSRDRRRVELPTYVFERAKQIADAEERTVASVVHELLAPALWDYKAMWTTADREKLTPRAARVLELAETDEPRRFNHNYIGTEHLLLAFLTERDGVAGQVLHELGVDHAAVSQHVESMIGRGETAVTRPLDYAPRVRKLLSLALRSASDLDHGLVGTGHLLLGLVREGNGIAAGILKRLGVNREQVDDRVKAALASGARPLADT